MRLFRRAPRYYGSHRRMSNRLLALVGVLLAIIVIGSIAVHISYSQRLKPVSDVSTPTYITIATGTPPADIAELLYDKSLIRSADAFIWYITTHNQRDKLQAGTYRLAPNMSTPTIAEMIANGKVASDLVTILPGQTLAEIRKTFIMSGFKVTDVDTALRADQYPNNPALADSPRGATLEGFLYPDSYQKTSATSPQQIVEQSLGEMQKALTTEIRNGFAAQGLTVYQGVTLASMIEKEVPTAGERAQVAQVFLSRLRLPMRLSSDASRDYAKVLNDPSYDSYANDGLPPGPISSVSQGALNAVIKPAGTSWLYFVTGDDKVTRFSQTFEQHQDNIDKYCQKRCG